MPIIFARVDDRLVHGQVVQAWLPQLNVDEVMIPFRKEKEASLNRGLLRLSLPYEYNLVILETHACMRYALGSRQRILVLAPSLRELADLIENGLALKSINIGGMHFKKGAQKLAENVFLDADDKRILKLIHDLGVEIETRAVPNEKSVSLKEVLS